MLLASKLYAVQRLQAVRDDRTEQASEPEQIGLVVSDPHKRFGVRPASAPPVGASCPDLGKCIPEAAASYMEGRKRRFKPIKRCTPVRLVGIKEFKRTHEREDLVVRRQAWQLTLGKEGRDGRQLPMMNYAKNAQNLPNIQPVVRIQNGVDHHPVPRFGIIREVHHVEETLRHCNGDRKSVV